MFYSLALPPVTIQHAKDATNSAPVKTFPVLLYIIVQINENTITADITTAVKKFPAEDREVILLKIIAKVSGTVQAQSGKSSSRSRDEEDYFSDIFGDRRR